VSGAREPIIAFTDANTCLERDSLQLLVHHFEDPAVGAVCGELVLRAAGGGDNVDGIYWRIERLLKRSESAVGALLGANGAIYAVRRECFVPIRPDTIVDDFCIAMTVAANGKVLVYEPRARAIEDAPPRIVDEFWRRVRIGIGNYQAFFRHPEYLFGAGVATAIAYLSHKVLRWFTPHLLALALLVNLMLLDEPLYRYVFAAQMAGYTACTALYLMSQNNNLPRLLRLPVFLAAMNIAFVVGFWRYVSGNYSGSWKRTVRV
jgi:cellulose synthase/poly-beta-1,6-N-acetylglucosamine synthase-like glycosyltransferase